MGDLAAERQRIVLLRLAEAPPAARDLHGKTEVAHAVRRLGELAETETLFTAPQHDYTKELLRLAPSLDRILSRQTVAE